MPKGGPKEYEARVEIRLSEKQRSRLMQWAKRNGESVSALVRRLIEKRQLELQTEGARRKK